MDHRTDLFSLGVMLYEMASGQRPFQGKSSAELASSILRDLPANLTELKVDLPEELARIVQQCLEKDPERRCRSARDLYEALATLREALASGERSSTAPHVTRRPPAVAPTTGVVAAPRPTFLEIEGVPARDRYEKAIGIVKKALEIDDSLGEGHASMALLIQDRDWDLVGAEREYRRALELSPNYASAHHWYGEMLVQMGRFDEGFERYRQALEVDPLSSAIRSSLGLQLTTPVVTIARSPSCRRRFRQIRSSVASTTTWHGCTRRLAGIGRRSTSIRRVGSSREATLMASRGRPPRSGRRSSVRVPEASGRSCSSSSWRRGTTFVAIPASRTCCVGSACRPDDPEESERAP